MILHGEAIGVRPGQFPQMQTELPSVTLPTRAQAIAILRIAAS